MTIETKYDVRDIVWFMYNNKIESSPVRKIDITRKIYLWSTVTYVKYKLALSYVANIDFEEDELFPTKEELLKSL